MEEEKINNIGLYGIPHMNGFSQQQIQTTNFAIDQVHQQAELEALRVPLRLHDPLTAGSKYPPLMVEELAKGNIGEAMIRTGNTHMQVDHGDGIGSLLNGQKCSNAADFIIKDHRNRREMQGQIKFGQTPENTHQMVKNHQSKNPEIPVFVPEGHEVPGAETKIIFGEIEARMPNAEKTTAFFNDNKELLDNIGRKYKDIEGEIANKQRVINSEKSRLEGMRRNPRRTNPAQQEIEKQELINHLETEKQQLIKQRDEILDTLETKMTEFYPKEFSWKAAFLEGFKYGAITGAVVGFIQCLIDSLIQFKEGKMSLGAFTLNVGKSMGITGVSGGVIGGLQNLGTTFANIAESTVGKYLAVAAKYAGGILCTVMGLVTIGTVLHTAIHNDIGFVDTTLQAGYSAAVFGVSIAGSIFIATSITGPLGFALGTAFAITIGVLDHFFGLKLQFKEDNRQKTYEFMERLSGVQLNIFGIPPLMQNPTPQTEAPVGFGLPQTQYPIQSSFGLPSLF